ncbi:MAG: phosphoenolpyruvate--protein phosphotransferase [Candidatus Hydrogenedentes bacterium]|nr:phosphoenolpyruvate--protein phosphotransferase [Candidatus Hydrogenedentota bacterium]
MVDSGSAKETHLSGLAVSEGVVYARAVVLHPISHQAVPWYRIEPEQAPAEQERAAWAMGQAAGQIDGLAVEVSSRIGKAQANIFLAQKMMVEDETLHAEIRQVIESELLNAEAAIAKCLDKYEKLLQAVDNSYMSERAADIGEIRRRLLDIMAGKEVPGRSEDTRALFPGFHIIVSADLTPSDTVNLNTDKTLGFITEHGGPASHAAILARAMGIPSVSGIERVHERINTGDYVLLDGDAGDVIIHPRPDTLALYPTARRQAMRAARRVPPVEGFTVLANIGRSSELPLLEESGAEGVGLYRTEFEFLAMSCLLGEDAQYERYASVVRSQAGKPVYMRLLDLGGDKGAPCLSLDPEENPCLGFRGARLLLGRPDLLQPHVRALARASRHGAIHLTYPMIVDADQFLVLRERIRQFIADIPDTQLLHGVMFEVPSACLLADELMAISDFGSIGTNDLIQYLFAIDRNNERVAGDYNPDKPVFWKLLRQIAEAAARHGRPLSVCGEIGGQPACIPKLIDLGLRCVSVSPRQIGLARVAARQYLESLAAR